MIGYTTIGISDLPRAVKYYDVLMDMFNAGRFMEEKTFVAWAESMDKTSFSVTKLFDDDADGHFEDTDLKVVTWY